MHIDDYFFNRKKYRFALENFEFWLTRCLELDDAWVNVYNMREWTPNKFDEKLLTAIEQQLANARAHLEREKRQLIVWIRQAPHGKKNSK
jgi:hypothetical protein